MKRWIGRSVLLLIGLGPWAEAGRLSLSDLARPDLAGCSTGLPELRKEARIKVRALADSGGDSDILIKFRGIEEFRALTVSAADAAQAVRVLRRRSDVEAVEQNVRLLRQFEPSDPLIGSQWHHDRIGSANAWDWGTGSSAVKIAIVDAPFNLAHPDLAANAVSGWDVVNQVSVTSGNDDHASMCAGLASGVVDNGTGIAGMGNFTLVPVNNAYADLSSDIIQLDAAIRWSADHGIRVVSMSWDGAYSSALNLAAKYLRDTIDGVVVMAGVNGSGFLNYTNQPYILAVSMTDSSDVLQSHYGPHIDFSAPGLSVYSTSVNGYTTGNGTSYATPLVAGLLAALFSINPSLTAADAISILKTTAVDLGAPGWDDHYGWGRIDYGRAAWLAAATADNVASLGRQQMETWPSNITVSTEYHPGFSYVLMGTPCLDPASWTVVPASVQTNGTTIDFSVAPTDEAAFFKITGTLNLQ